MADSLHEGVMDAAVTVIEGLSLPKSISTRVYRKKTLDKVNVAMPCILVVLDDAREEMGPFSTEEDERVLPVMVALIDRRAERDQSDLPSWLDYRERIANAFLMQLLPGSDDGPAKTWHVDVRPSEVLDQQRVLGPEYEGAVGAFWILPRIITARVRT